MAERKQSPSEAVSSLQLIRDVTGRIPLIQAQEKPVLLRPSGVEKFVR